jgi:chromosome segregation ATPase
MSASLINDAQEFINSLGFISPSSDVTPIMVEQSELNQHTELLKMIDDIAIERNKAVEENKQLRTVLEVYEKKCEASKTQSARVSKQSQEIGNKYAVLIKEHEALKKQYDDEKRQLGDIIYELNERLNRVCSRRDEVEWMNMDLISECEELQERLTSYRENSLVECQVLKDQNASLQEKVKTIQDAVEMARPVYEENERTIGRLTQQLKEVECHYAVLKQMYSDECESSCGMGIYKELYMSAKHELDDIKEKIIT